MGGGSNSLRICSPWENLLLQTWFAGKQTGSNKNCLPSVAKYIPNLNLHKPVRLPDNVSINY